VVNKLSVDSVFAQPRAPHQRFVVKASIDFPGFRVWAEIPLSEHDEHRLRTSQLAVHTFYQQVIEGALADAISKHFEDRADSEGPVTTAPGKPVER
jgi:hypothetical protein